MNIRPNIQDLVDRGNVTPAEVAELRCNSWEWQALIPSMNDEAFVAFVDRALQNIGVNQPRPFSTYDESLKGLLAPELLKRFNRAKLAYEQTIYELNCRVAELKQESERLVEAVEFCQIDGGCRAFGIFLTDQTKSPTSGASAGSSQTTSNVIENASVTDRTSSAESVRTTLAQKRDKSGETGATQEMWIVRLWPSMKVIETFPTEVEARERGVGSGYRIEGPYLLGDDK